MALYQKLQTNLSRLAIPPNERSAAQDWRGSSYQQDGAHCRVPHRLQHVAAYAVPNSPTAMSLSPGGPNVYLPPPPPPPPPPPRSPASAGSGSFPLHRRLPVQPPSIQTALGGAHHQGTGGGDGGHSPYPYSPAAALNTPLSPYASPGFPSLSQNSSAASSPMALRPSTAGNTMVAEYNPQQWGRAGVGPTPTGVQYRAFNTQRQAIHAPRAVDENGGKPLSPICFLLLWKGMM
jgi:hypothetical protein